MKENTQTYSKEGSFWNCWKEYWETYFDYQWELIDGHECTLEWEWKVVTSLFGFENSFWVIERRSVTSTQRSFNENSSIKVGNLVAQITNRPNLS